MTSAVNLVATAEGSTQGASPVYDFNHSLPDFAGAQVSSSGSYTPGAPALSGSPTGATNGGEVSAPGGTSPPPVYNVGGGGSSGGGGGSTGGGGGTVTPPTNPPIHIHPPVNPPRILPMLSSSMPSSSSMSAGATTIKVEVTVQGNVLSDKSLADVVSKAIADRMNMRSMQTLMRIT